MKAKILQTRTSTLLLSLLLLMALGWSNTAFGQATVYTDMWDYYPGDIVMIMGEGWEPGETVKLEIIHNTITTGHHIFYTEANDAGEIYHYEFLIIDDHLGEFFELIATGLSSGQVASTEFIDAPRLGSVTDISQTSAACTGASTDVTFNYTVTRGSNTTGNVSATISITSVLPTGITFTGLPITVSVPSAGYDGSFYFSIPSSIASGNYSFSMRAAAQGDQDVATGTGTIIVSPLPAAPTLGTNTHTYDGTVKTAIANPPVGASVVWYDAATGGSVTTAPSGTNAGTYTAWAEAVNDENGCVSATRTQVDLVINKAPLTFTADNHIVTYGDAIPNLTYTITGFVSGENEDNISGMPSLTTTYTNATPVAASPVSVSITAGDLAAANYSFSFVGGAISIEKANATIVVNGTTVTYDGEEHGATGTATGVKGEALAGLDLGDKFTNVPGGTAEWTFTDVTGNYNDDEGEVAIVINKADATIDVSGTTVTYDGEEHGASGTATGVNDELLAGLDLGAKFTNVPGGTANWTFTDVTGNYNDDAGSVAIVINKADATIVVEGTTVTYDGEEHGATGTATGVKDEALAGLDLGAKFTNVPGGTANWTFTDETGNYNDDAGSVAIVINKADATIVVEGTTVTYDGEEHGATGTATGVKGEALAGLDLGAKFTNVPGGTANWTFTDVTGNYNDDAGSVAIVINKADATIVVEGTTVTYNGEEHGATGTATGVKDEALAGLDLGAKFTNVPGGTANWTFTDVTGNYNDDAGSVAIVINKADATIVVEGTTVTYDGEEHGATGTATGVKDEALAGLDLGAKFTNVPGGTANWTFTDVTGNYNDDAGSVAIVINKADATIVVEGTTVTYDGEEHGATGTATGVKDEALAGLDLGAKFTNVPGGTANWTFTDVTGNYNDDAGSVAIVINKADATIVVEGTTVTYDGEEHGATGTATGVKDEALAGLDLGAKFTNVPGGTANWTFTDVTGNYNDDAGSVAIVINKADATIVVEGTTVTYDGEEHGATGTATGVKDEALAGLDLGAKFTNVPGGTANWTFTDVTGNYNDDAGSVAIVINKADATIVVEGTTVTYDGEEHGATGTATGVKDEALAGLDLGAKFTNVPGGTANWTFTDVTGNYNDDAGSVAIVINKADATIVVEGTTVTYDGEEHGATGSATGVKGEALAGLDLGAKFTNVPGGTANWTFTDVTGNYNDDAGSVAIVINKADATIVVEGTTVTYDGEEHGATGTATGVKDEALAGLDLGAKFTNVPGGTANWTFTDVTGNYNDDAGSVAIVINKADATIVVEGTTVTYDGEEHGATGTATGVKDEALAGLDLGAKFTNVPGGTANWTFTDVTGNYNDDAGSVAIVINKADATIVVEGTTVTYDGEEHGATGSATGVKGEALAGLDLGDKFTNVPGGTAEWTFTDETGNYNYDEGSVEIVINKAPLTFEYLGTRLIATTTGSAVLDLKALVVDEDCLDTRDLSTADIWFEIENIGNEDAELTVLSSGCEAIAFAEYTAEVSTLKITIHAGGNYSGSFGPVLVVVYSPDGDHVTGGGYIIPSASNGSNPSDNNTHANFGFNIKYQKRGKETVLQGEMNLVIRSNEQMYQFKSTEALSLGINTNNDSEKQANFTFKGNFHQGNNNIVVPNVIMFVTMIDRGNPGIGNDEIGFTIWNEAGDLIYSNKWVNYATVRELLAGGNLVVHKGGAAEGELILINPEEDAISEDGIAIELPVDMDFRVFPNPFRDRLNFRFAPVKDSQVRLELFDMTGALVEVLFEGSVAENQLVEVQYIPQLRNATFLFYRLTMGTEVRTGKVMYQK
jgi:hypothetical protein